MGEDFILQVSAIVYMCAILGACWYLLTHSRHD